MKNLENLFPVNQKIIETSTGRVLYVGENLSFLEQKYPERYGIGKRYQIINISD